MRTKGPSWLTELHVFFLCRGGWVIGKMLPPLPLGEPWAHLVCHSLDNVHGEMFELTTEAPKPVHRYKNTEVSP